MNPIGQRFTGQYEFNEVVFTDYFVPDDHVLGESTAPGSRRLSSRLRAFRSGAIPETYYVLTELVRRGRQEPGHLQREGHRPTGCAVAHHAADVGLTSACCAGMAEASVVSDTGTVQSSSCFGLRARSRRLRRGKRHQSRAENQPPSPSRPQPKLTIQGGTTEVLRRPRGLGLR